MSTSGIFLIIKAAFAGAAALVGLAASGLIVMVSILTAIGLLVSLLRS